MAHIEVGGRVYLTNDNDFAYKQRIMLGIISSALVLSDEGLLKGFVGLQAKEVLVNPVTKTNELDEIIEVPTDFRTTGLLIMEQIGIPIETQTKMFDNFIKNYTKEERKSFVDIYDNLDKTNETAVHDFVSQMITMLTS